VEIIFKSLSIQTILNSPPDLSKLLTYEQVLLLYCIAGERKAGKKNRIFYLTDLKKRKDLASVDVDKVLAELESKRIVQKDGKGRWKVLKNKIEHDARKVIIYETMQKLMR